MFTKSLKIIGDVDRRKWDAYLIYLKKIDRGFDEFKRIDIKRPQLRGVFLRKLAKQALRETNKEVGFRSRLKNLWNRLGFKKAIGAYSDFNDDPELDYIWRRYITDETLFRSVFRTVDRVKLSLMLIGSILKP